MKKGTVPIIHIGKQIPKHLKKLGYREVSAKHIGQGLWILRLEIPA